MRNVTKASAVVAMAAALALTSCAPGGTSAPGGVDDGCTVVNVATSSEKVNMMEELGELFKSSAEHDALDECATVYPQNVSSGKAADLLAESSSEWALGEQNAPSVWSPASTVWTARVASIAGAGLVDDAESFAKTPVVFGIPESMAEALGYPGKPIGIKDIEQLIASEDGWGSVGKDMWGSFKISKTNPNTSTTGMSMLLMQAYANSGKTEGLTADDVKASEDFSRTFESGAIHYGDTTGKVLQNLYDRSRGGSGSSYVSAIALEETSLFNYNMGNPDSHTVQPGEELEPPREKLVAVYPSEGSMWSDNPAVVVNADWVDPAQRAAAEAFVAFLHTKPAQEVLPKYGFRPLDDQIDVSTHLNADVGIDPAQPAVTLEQPDPGVVSAAIDQWASIRKPSAVLELIDISGSMDDSMGDGRSKLEGAIEGAQSTLQNVRSTDLIGIWAFTTGIGTTIDGDRLEGIAEVRAFEALGGEKEKLRGSLDDLFNSTRSGTPLYDAIDAAYDYMSERAETGRINAIVVLSDGEDTDSLTQLDSLIQKVNTAEAEGVNDKPVRIFAIAYGEGADVEALERLATASGGQVFDATDPTRIAEVFQSVMNNF